MQCMCSNDNACVLHVLQACGLQSMWNFLQARSAGSANEMHLNTRSLLTRQAAALLMIIGLSLRPYNVAKDCSHAQTCLVQQQAYLMSQ